MALHFDPATVWSPFGAFSMGVVVGAGRLVHLKGQVALDRDGNLVGRGDLPAQLRQALDNIASVLAAVGGEMRDIITLTQFTTDIDGFMACGAIRERYFSAPYPATTTVQVVRLYDPDVLVEIAAAAEVPLSRYRPPGRLSRPVRPDHGAARLEPWWWPDRAPKSSAHGLRRRP